MLRTYYIGTLNPISIIQVKKKNLGILGGATGRSPQPPPIGATEFSQVSYKEEN